MADVQAYLQAEGLVDGATGWPSSRGAVHDGSDRLVVVTEDGGPEPEQPASGAVREVAVQVLVRGAPHERDAVAAKAEAIYDALHGLTGATLGSTTYIGITAQSGPVATYDDKGRRVLTTSYRLMAGIDET